MKVNTKDIQGKIIRDTTVYTVIDNDLLDNLTLSKTILNPLERTSGRSAGAYHRVYNDMNNETLEFICVFQKYNREDNVSKVQTV